MFAVQPVRIYANTAICQIIYHELVGKHEEYQSKYQHNSDIQPSLLFEELDPNHEVDPQLPLDFGLERSHS